MKPLNQINEIINDYTNVLTGIELLPTVIGTIRQNIKKGAKDQEQEWKDSLELVNKAFQVSGAKIPHLGTVDWDIYEDLIAYGVNQMAKTRGLKDYSWRLASELNEMAQEIKGHRFFVDFTGEGTVELLAKDFSSVVKQLNDRLKRHGKHLRTEKMDDNQVLFTIWLDNVKIDRITIRKVK